MIQIFKDYYEHSACNKANQYLKELNSKNEGVFYISSASLVIDHSIYYLTVIYSLVK